MEHNFYSGFLIVIYILAALGIVVGAFFSTDAKNNRNKRKGKIILLVSVAVILVVAVAQAIMWATTSLG
jgi:hypothetical protein